MAANRALPCLKRWPVKRVDVAEHSMLPALRPGRLAARLPYPRIRPGQVVLAWAPGPPGLLLVKRGADGPAGAGGGWWLASDIPAAGAADSARFGPVPEELIVGRVLARYWPRSVKPLPRFIRNVRPTASGPAPDEGCGA